MINFGKRKKDMDNQDVTAKYWIKGGVSVIHRDHVTDLNMDRLGFYKMVVDKVVKRSKGEDGQRRTYIEGVRCHWLDSDMKFQTGQFHTGELVPFDIALGGIDKVNAWTESRN